MSDPISPLVREPLSERSAEELLSRPVTVLVSVTDEDAATLAALDVHTVFDLATSKVFGAARWIIEGAAGGNTHLARYGTPPADILADDATGQTALALIVEDLAALEDLPEAQRAAVVEMIGGSTVRDLGVWPPYRAARLILGQAYGGVDEQYDPDAPKELIPTAGRHSTETLSYRKIFIDQVDTSLAAEPETQPLESSDGIDIFAGDEKAAGFDRPATGAVLYFQQSWYPEAVSLGQLLHSVGLAPGESTKVVVIDWARQEAARLDESATQDESAAATVTRSRAIDELQSAVASEVQRGYSRTDVESTSHSWGIAGGIAGGAAALGFGYGGSTTRGSTETVSSSSGRRNVSAGMRQQITDSTRQSSTAVRNRRASVVKEVRQEEREEIRTRVITNYNHSHALSIHYYEVVQIYRTETSLRRVQRCLFVPMKLLDFSDRRVIERFRSILLRSTPDPYVRELIQATLGRIEVRRTLDYWYDSAVVARYAEQAVEHQYENATESVRNRVRREMIAGGSEQRSATRNRELARYAGHGVEGTVVDGTLKIPPNAILVGAGVSGVPGNGVLDRLIVQGEQGPITDGAVPPEGAAHIDLPIEVPLSEITSIQLDYEDTRDADIREMVLERLFMLHLIFRINDEQVTLNLHCVLPTSPRGPAVVLGVSQPANFTELIPLLQEQALYYSQQIWKTLDPQTLAYLMGRFTYQGRRVVEQIDPVPLTAHGNYLVFQWHPDEVELSDYVDTARSAEADRLVLLEGVEVTPDQRAAIESQWRWEHWRDRHADTEAVEEARIPLPTDGLFVEAVLGRFNASERIDPERFWDWQDSPIPHQAPEIAPVQAGSRATDPGLASPRMEAPIVQIQNPPSLPDPTGVGAALSVLATANLFRDMSGRTAGAALLGQATQSTTLGASAAMSTAAGIVGAAMSAGAAAGGSADRMTSSQFGAALNAIRKMEDSAGGSSGGRSGSTGTAAGSSSGRGPAGRPAGSPGALEEDVVWASVDPRSAAANRLRREMAGLASPDGGAGTGVETPSGAGAAAEFQIALRGMGAWTYDARRLWTGLERSRTARWQDEPATNIDRLPIPPWLDAEKWRVAMEDHYSREHTAVVAGNPNFSRAPSEILGDFSQPVAARYFVIHDTAVEREPDRARVGNNVHLWLGTQNLVMAQDWHLSGDATKVERARNTCFVHVELSRAPADLRESGTGIFAFSQYWDLANAYLAASFRAGRFLTVTAHREVDRSVVQRRTDGTLSHGHNDPEDFNLELFYALVGQSLELASVDGSVVGFGGDTTFGIAPDRAATENQAGQVNGFVAFVRGNVPEADQYGPVRTRPDYRTYDERHDVTDRAGRRAYLANNLPGTVACGGASWPAEASYPPAPSELLPYLQDRQDDIPTDVV